MVLDASFNLQKSMVCTPDGTVRTFVCSGLDLLFLDRFVVRRWLFLRWFSLRWTQPDATAQ